jgi:hypothetical protein
VRRESNILFPTAKIISRLNHNTTLRKTSRLDVERRLTLYGAQRAPKGWRRGRGCCRWNWVGTKQDGFREMDLRF